MTQVMMQVGFYGHVRQYHNIQSEIDANIRQVLESGEYVQGPMLKRFEQELGAFHGMKHAIGTGNGTDAIWLALMAMGVGAGDEVITHPNTFFATAEAIWIAGATAVFVDCDPRTKCIAPKRSRPRSREDEGHHSRASVRPVRRHASNQEDCRYAPAAGDRRQCPGHRRRGNGFRIGHLSDATSVSFIAQKNLGTFGDGGAILTNDATSTPECASCATTGRTSATFTASASTAGWTICTRESSAPS